MNCVGCSAFDKCLLVHHRLDHQGCEKGFAWNAALGLLEQAR